MKVRYVDQSQNKKKNKSVAFEKSEKPTSEISIWINKGRNHLFSNNASMYHRRRIFQVG